MNLGMSQRDLIDNSGHFRESHRLRIAIQMEQLPQATHVDLGVLESGGFSYHTTVATPPSSLVNKT
jgi:hypothetical protein